MHESNVEMKIAVFIHFKWAIDCWKCVAEWRHWKLPWRLIDQSESQAMQAFAREWAIDFPRDFDPELTMASNQSRAAPSSLLWNVATDNWSDSSAHFGRRFFSLVSCRFRFGSAFDRVRPLRWGNIEMVESIHVKVLADWESHSMACRWGIL